jgi:CDP-glucose 4,6-dehydratase
MNREFWHSKKVFLTGHTGFKGGWMTAWLQSLGARVAGFSLAPNTVPSFFELCQMVDRMDSVIGDVRNLPLLMGAIANQQPEILFHLAAQPLVRRSYKEPVETLSTNIMGTIHMLEAARHVPSVRAVIVITSDKCYYNRGWVWGYREDEPMGGRDPYAASKGCAELVAASYQHSYFRTGKATLATARAGNVIGGGDWSEDRIVPDAIRAFTRGQSLAVRSPTAQRPWQHVLEPISGYLMLAEKVHSEQQKWEGGWNFGPYDADVVPVSALSDLIVQSWGDDAAWHNAGDPEAPHEEPYLKLDSSKARHSLGWRPRLSIKEAVEWTTAWHKHALKAGPGDEVYEFTKQQIRCYEARGQTAER